MSIWGGAVDSEYRASVNPVRPMIEPGPDNLLDLARRQIRADVEHEQQVALFLWADQASTIARYPEIEGLYAVPNFSIRLNGKLAHIAKRQNERLRKEGKRPGMWDVCLPAGHGGWLSLRIEMKTERGALSAEQKIWERRLSMLGNKCEVHRSWESARDAIVAYLALPLTAGVRRESA